MRPSQWCGYHYWLELEYSLQEINCWFFVVDIVDLHRTPLISQNNVRHTINIINVDEIGFKSYPFIYFKIHVKVVWTGAVERDGC